MHPLLSTAAPHPLPAPIVERDPYAEGYAAGRLDERAAVVAWLGAAAAPLPPSWARESLTLGAVAEILARLAALVGSELPDPTADRAQLAALGQRGDQGA